jgi:hypothetical protein
MVRIIRRKFLIVLYVLKAILIFVFFVLQKNWKFINIIIIRTSKYEYLFVTYKSTLCDIKIKEI